MEEREMENIEKRYFEDEYSRISIPEEERLKISIPEGEHLKLAIHKGYGEPMINHHYHNFYEIYYMVDGKGTYFINDKLYDVVAGDIIIVSPNIIHSTNYGNKERARVLLEFTDGLLPKYVRDKLRQLPNLYRHPGVSQEVYLILRDIAKEYNSPDEFSREEIINLTSHLVVTLLRNLGAVNVVNSRDAVISEVVAFIKENYRTNITLSQLAEMHFISPEHLSRSFKKETNFGFNEFIALIRLHEAEKLLKNKGGMSIAEVAYACGFNDSNYFSDKFKRTYGMSPLQYSKSFRGGKTQRARVSKKKKNGSDSGAAE